MTQLRQLTPEERAQAKIRAETNTNRRTSRAPDPRDYQGTTVANWPPWLTKTMVGLLTVTALAAASISLLRVHNAGRDAFLRTATEIGVSPRAEDAWQAVVFGIATFLLAEFTIIAGTLAARTLFTGKARWLMAAPVVIGAATALLGNWTSAKTSQELQSGDIARAAWAIIETLGPPLAVISVAFILERLALKAIETQHAHKVEFEIALAKHKDAIRDPNGSPFYQAELTSALQAALTEANSRGAGARLRAEYMLMMTREDWTPYIRHEMIADRWSIDPDEPIITIRRLPEPPTTDEDTQPTEDLTAEALAKYRPDLVRQILED